eukprot:Opistho-2@48885
MARSSVAAAVSEWGIQTPPLSASPGRTVANSAQLPQARSQSSGGVGAVASMSDAQGRGSVNLDAFLRTLMNTSDPRDFNSPNFDAIARLLPGVTAKQCALRWEEMRGLKAPSPATNRNPVAAPLNGSNSGNGSGRAFLSINGRDITSVRPEGNSASPRQNATQTDQRPSQSAENASTRPPPDAATVQGQRQGGDAHAHESAGAVPQQQRPKLKVYKSPIVDDAERKSIVIHVCDEAKKVTQDFLCDRIILTREMRYFASYLSEKGKGDELDISVHCDIKIFDWLMKYIHAPNEDDRPNLDAQNVVSILISSDFLLMPNLATDCLQFCANHIGEIIRLPLNLDCIHDKLLAQLVRILTPSQFEAIEDKKDRILSRLYMHRLEVLCNSSPVALGLFRCGACFKVLTPVTRSSSPCTGDRASVGYSGAVIHTHVRDTSFDVNTFVASLRLRGLTWPDVYWRTWGLVTHADCSACGGVFPYADFRRCVYHPQVATYSSASGGGTANALGSYPCCGRAAVRFDPSGGAGGCSSRDHTPVLETYAQRESHETFLKHAMAIAPNDAGVEASPSSVAAAESHCVHQQDSGRSRGAGGVPAASSRINVFTAEELASGVPMPVVDSLRKPTRGSRAVGSKSSSSSSRGLRSSAQQSVAFADELGLRGRRARLVDRSTSGLAHRNMAGGGEEDEDDGIVDDTDSSDERSSDDEEVAGGSLSGGRNAWRSNASIARPKSRVSATAATASRPLQRRPSSLLSGRSTGASRQSLSSSASQGQGLASSSSSAVAGGGSSGNERHREDANSNNNNNNNNNNNDNIIIISKGINRVKFNDSYMQMPLP